MTFLFYKSAYDHLAVAAWQPSGEHVRAALPFFILFSTVHGWGEAEMVLQSVIVIRCFLLNTYLGKLEAFCLHLSAK
jgi:hypothetical protein